MAQTNVNVRMDAELKRQFEDFCSDIGMTMSSAINVFAKQAVKEYRIPFQISAEKPNVETIEAIREVEYMKKHPEEYKSYSSAKEMIKDL